MATPCFYHGELSEQDKLIELSSSESAHLSKSRRLKPGDQVHLINGKGLMAMAEVVAKGVAKGVLANNKQVQIQCSDFVIAERPLAQISVATAIPKGDRAKVMVDMLTQLGVDRIFPMRCDYSETRFNEKNREKWQRVAIEACKQSQNPWLPQIESEWDFKSLISDLDKLSKDRNKNNGALPQVIYTDISGADANKLEELDSELIVMIGPEGGFSNSELAALKSINALSVCLGQHILRTELAAIAAVAQLRAIAKL